MGLARQALLLAVLCGLGYAFYVYAWPHLGSADAQTAAERRGRSSAVEVVVEPVRLVPERARIEAVGTAEALRSASLHSATSGEVVGVSIVPDGAVHQGDLLLELESRKETLDLDLTRLRVDNARRLLQRYERTKGSGAVPESVVDEARNALAEAEIAFRQAEVALTNRMVLAPFDGNVGMTDVEVGDRIDSGDMVTTLDDRSRLHIDFAVPEIFLGRIGIGHRVSVATWAERKNPIAGQIVELGSRIDPASRSFTARAEIANPADRLRPGMSFAVSLEVLGRNYPLVPESAVQWGAEGAYLWVVRDGKAAQVLLTVVQRQEGTVLVDAPLAAGEPVVVEGVQRLRDGTEVAPAGASAATS